MAPVNEPEAVDVGAGRRPPVRFGARLRRVRQARRMSLGDLAQRSGVTASFLSRVERDETSPSVASLVTICEALGLPVADLFAVPETTLVRVGDRAALDQLPATAHVTDTLITPAWASHVTVMETIAAPGGSGGEELYTLLSQTEVCFVLEGTVEVLVEDQRFRLQAGDALTFGAAVPHTWRNAGDTGARILWILAPGLPDPQGEAARTALRVAQLRDAGDAEGVGDSGETGDSGDSGAAGGSGVSTLGGGAAGDLRAAADALVAAFGEGRVEDYFACFAPEATFVFHSTPERLETREAYRALWAAWERDDGLRVLACESRSPQVSMLGPDAGVFVHDVDTRVATTAGAEDLRERETIVFARRQGRWLAVHEHLSPRPPAGL